MIILNIGHISNSVQIITDAGYTRTYPMEERCGELYFKFNGTWHKVNNYKTIYTVEHF